MKKTNLIFVILLLFISSRIFAQITVKDQEKFPNTLFQVNDEGSAGSVTLYDTKMSLSGSKLYNYGNDLYWGSKKLGFAGSAAGWIDVGLVVHTLNSNDRVGIGTSTPGSLLHVQTINTHSKLATTNDGVYGESNKSGGSGVAGINTGSGNGIYGRSKEGYAGKFDGNINVTGKIYNSQNINIESLNDTIILKAGNTTLTIEPNGIISIQSSADVKIQTEGDLQLVSEGDLGLHGNNVNIGATDDITIDAGMNMAIQTSKDFSVDANENISLTADMDLFFQNLSAFNKMFRNGNINIEGQEISVKASGNLILKGSNITDN